MLSGTAIAAATLESLMDAGATGVFASHLHLLAALPLDEARLTRWRMEVCVCVCVLGGSMWPRGAAWLPRLMSPLMWCAWEAPAVRPACTVFVASTAGLHCVCCEHRGPATPPIVCRWWRTTPGRRARWWGI